MDDLKELDAGPSLGPAQVIPEQKIDYLQTSFQTLNDAANQIFNEARKLETSMLMPDDEK